MRPVNRGASPQPADFANYRDAFGPLQSRLGPYCSYCERRIPTNLAVEHIQPKGLLAYEHLIGCWSNFLLGCVNCNSTKGDKDVHLDEVFIPDRDNTAAAFDYTPDGKVAPAAALLGHLRLMAEATLALAGLEKPISRVLDENGKLVAIDRVSQRMEAWLIARESKSDLLASPQPDESMRRQIAKTAAATGFFSIWMKVFADDRNMRRRFITAFPGTATDCYDQNDTYEVSPRPAANGLPHGGKI